MTIQNLPKIKRKRGRPPKNKAALVQEPVIVKRKRGRPPKNKTALLQEPVILKKRRGRPPKNQVLPKAKEAKVTPATKTNENYVTGKLFTHSKHVSKQEDWYIEWESNCWNSFNKRKWGDFVLSLKDLQNGINKILGKVDEPKLSIHIPIIRLMQDEEVLKIVFDPLNKGVDVHIFYRSKDFPLGLTPSLKATAVCNKVTDLIKSFVPVGISG